MRRRTIAVTALVALGAAGAGGYVVAGRGGDDAAADVPPAESPRSFAAVTRQDLRRYDELAATVGYGEPTPIVLALDGTITALPAVDDVIEPGDSIAAVDSRPIPAAAGAVPMWRDLQSGVADGVDVQQVEEMLRALGYAETFDVTVDDKWTNATTRAVRAWQADAGLPVTGTIGRGELVFLAGPVRVASVAGSLGQAASEAGITVTGTELAIITELTGRRLDLLAVGDEVEVELPNGDVVAARVTELGAATTDSDGKASRPVELAVTGDGAGISNGGGAAPGTSVTVRVPRAAATDVLTVPVEALLAVAEGGYAVEVRTESGAPTTALVGVEIGTFADGRVEITPTTGAITEGDEVIIP